jgi:hypothetical protein
MPSVPPRERVVCHPLASLARVMRLVRGEALASVTVNVLTVVGIVRRWPVPLLCALAWSSGALFVLAVGALVRWMLEASES